MPELIDAPSRVTAAGEPPKLIDEYIGRVATGEARLSVAHMRSPSGWSEPGQRRRLASGLLTPDGPSPAMA